MSYATEVLADSPYFFWELDELSGTLAEDASTNNRDGSISTVPAPTFGQSSLIATETGGRSILFASSTQNTVTSPFLLNTSQVTIECWVQMSAYPVTNPGLVVGFLEGYNNNTKDKLIYIDTAGKPRFYTYSSGAETHTSVPTNALALDTSHHLVATNDGTTSRVYANGVEVGSVAAAGTYTGYTINNIFVSSDGNGSSPVMDKLAGYIDEVAVWTTALSANRILTHYMAGVGTATLPAIQSRVPMPMMAVPDRDRIMRMQGG